MIIDSSYKDENKHFYYQNETIKNSFFKLNNIQYRFSSFSKFEIFRLNGKFLSDIFPVFEKSAAY